MALLDDADRPVQLGSSIPRSPHALLPDLPENHLGPEANLGSLQRQLLNLLHEFYKQGQLLGAQLSVVELPRPADSRGTRPQILADCAVGVKSWLKPELVDTNTFFNIMDMSKLPLALSLLRLIDKGHLDLSAAVVKGEVVTLEHVLGHTAGMWQPLPDGISEVTQLRDFEVMLEATLKTQPAEPPGIAQRYHYASFGYLCAAACRNSGCDLQEAWQGVSQAASDMAVAHGMPPSESPELLLKLPEHLKAGTHGNSAAVQGQASSCGMEEVGQMMARLSLLMGQKEDADGDRSPLDGVAQKLWGRDHLLHSSLFAEDSSSEAWLPGLQAFGTARSMTGLLAAAVIPAAAGGLLSSNMAQDMLRSRKPSQTENESPESGIEELSAELGHVLRLEDFTNFGLGVQLVDSQSWGGRQSSAPAWGHLAQNGSMALVIPGERPLAVALLLNMTGRGDSGRQVAHSVLRALEASRV